MYMMSSWILVHSSWQHCLQMQQSPSSVHTLPGKLRAAAPQLLRHQKQQWRAPQRRQDPSSLHCCDMMTAHEVVQLRHRHYCFVVSLLPLLLLLLLFVSLLLLLLLPAASAACHLDPAHAICAAAAAVRLVLLLQRSSSTGC
jgi:hypothetical protein